MMKELSVGMSRVIWQTPTVIFTIGGEASDVDGNKGACMLQIQGLNRGLFSLIHGSVTADQSGSLVCISNGGSPIATGRLQAAVVLSTRAATTSLVMAERFGMSTAKVGSGSAGPSMVSVTVQEKRCSERGDPGEQEGASGSTIGLGGGVSISHVRSHGIAEAQTPFSGVGEGAGKLGRLYQVLLMGTRTAGKGSDRREGEPTLGYLRQLFSDVIRHSAINAFVGAIIHVCLILAVGLVMIDSVGVVQAADAIGDVKDMVSSMGGINLFP
ncbi:hypothetical protein NE237_023532 [Protea cynaroides]|uniref:Uncharacterized protein n=1 Tax=Protea cynaroides TaxID=273540 RepID=A0A9Q0HF53_9MAGN|nr:hypothetical protein NE237_023532 [Protea cynaroides]